MLSIKENREETIKEQNMAKKSAIRVALDLETTGLHPEQDTILRSLPCLLLWWNREASSRTVEPT